MTNEAQNSLLTVLASYGKKADQYANELGLLRVVIRKVKEFLVFEAPEWETCEHEFDRDDTLPPHLQRCLKCNAKATVVEILTLCREATK